MLLLRTPRSLLSFGRSDYQEQERVDCRLDLSLITRRDDEL